MMIVDEKREVIANFEVFVHQYLWKESIDILGSVQEETTAFAWLWSVLCSHAQTFLWVLLGLCKSTSHWKLGRGVFGKGDENDMEVGGCNQKGGVTHSFFSVFISPTAQFLLLISQWELMKKSLKGCYHLCYQYRKG